MKYDLENKIVSKMEARILRSLDTLCSINNPSFRFRVFSNLPLTLLLKNARQYMKKVDRVLNFDDEDFLPSSQIVWPSRHYPIFEWKQTESGERAYYAIGGPTTKGRSVYDKMIHSPANTEWICSEDKGRGRDPAAQNFLDAIQSCKTEDNLNAKLNSAYPRITTTNAEQRKSKIFMQSIDYVVTRDYGAYEPITHIDLNTAKNITPILAVEFDPTTNGCTVNGKLIFSEEFVETLFRLPDGSVDYVELSRREIKLKDKFAIFTDLGLPAAVLPHHAVEVLPLPLMNGQTHLFIKADMMFPHLNNIYRLMNDNLPLDRSNDAQVTDFLASNSYYGNQYSELKRMCVANGVKIEKIDMDISEILDEEYEPHMMGYEKFLKPVNVDTEKLLSSLGLGIQNYPGIRITAQYYNKTYVKEYPLPLGFGSNIMHQYDFCIISGLASHLLILDILADANTTS